MFRRQLRPLLSTSAVSCTWNARSASGLASVLANVIRTTGPISIASFMRQCLLNPEHGYYTTRNPLDSKTGDFVTSPEISSTFGEICGLWLFSSFLSQLKRQKASEFRIREKTFRFIEYGPGRGSLMNDILRTANRFIRQENPIEVVLVEKSDVLIREQHSTLCGDSSPLVEVDDLTFSSRTRWGNTIFWHKDDTLQVDMSRKYMNFVVAHEFFDALPINRFLKTEAGWREYLVDLNSRTNSNLLPNVTTTKTMSRAETVEKKFKLVVAPYATPSSSIPKSIPRFNSLGLGAKVEICPDSHRYISQFAEIVKSSDIGGGLVIDYGPLDTMPINSLRGIKDHKFVDPLEDPGEVDLSADVDFENLSRLLSEQGFKTYRAEQGDWLNSMGLGYRIDQLVEGKDEVTAKKIVDSYTRLAGKGLRDMGKVYKVLAFMDDKYTDVPPGFGGDI